MLISDVAPEADPAGSENRQEIIPESATDRIAKSGDLHGEKDETESHRVQRCMGSFYNVWLSVYHKNALQSNIDDGNYSPY